MTKDIMDGSNDPCSCWLVDELRNALELADAFHKAWMGADEFNEGEQIGIPEEDYMKIVDAARAYEKARKGKEKTKCEAPPYRKQEARITNGKIPRPQYESRTPNVCDDCASGPDCTDSGCEYRDDD